MCGIINISDKQKKHKPKGRKKEEKIMNYRIHEIETNVTYDDIYSTIEEAKQQIAAYKADDGDERNVTYRIIEECDC